MRKALVKRGGQIIEVDVDDNHVNQLRKAKTGLQVSKSSSDPCPPNFYWDEDEGECIPMSATLPKREELYTNPKMLKDLQRLNDKRRVTDYKKHYTKTRDSFWNENFKGPYIDENGQKVPDRNSPEFINYKKLSDDRFKDMPNPWFDKNFKLPEDFKKKDFYPKDGEWDEDSKKEFNEFFNTEPSQQEQEERILKEFKKNNSVSPDFDQRDIPKDDPSLQYKMNPDELRQYRYDEEWCPCYKTKDELIAGRMVTKKVCIPCEQAKMGGSLAKFMQDGGEGSKYPLNDQGEEIRYHKEFDRRGKRITKEKLVRPADPEMDRDRSSTRYVKRILEDSGQGRVVSRPSGIDYFLNPHHANFFGEPRDGSYIDYEINPNFNQQPRMFQMGGAPQEQMAQQQMPPQQEGQAQGQGSEQDQIMQLIQAYADAMGISPDEIIQELQQMNPEEQKQAIDQMAQELQGGQQAQVPEQQMSPEQMMQVGGASNIYTPDTGTEQYAPDPSWYEGGDQAAAPGNVVSWPSFPEGGRPMRRNIPNGTREVTPIETETRRVPRGRGTSTFFRNPSVPEQEYDDSSYYYEDEYNPVRRVPFFENLADRVGDGFDNIGDFFKKLKRRRGGRRGGRIRGNGLLNCKPGTKCFKFQAGGDTEGELDIDRFKPESKLKTFLQLAQGYGQDNYDEALEKDVYNDIKKFQIGGDTQNADGSSFYDYGSGYNPNKLKTANRFQGSADQFNANGNVFGAVANAAQTYANNIGQNLKEGIDLAKKIAPIAANVVAPGSGAIVGAAIKATDKPKDGATAGAGAAAGGFDPSSLMSMFAKFGGNLPRYQTAGTFDPTSLMPDFSNPEIGTNMALPPVEPDNSVEAWRKQMQDNSAATEDGKNWDPLQFNKKDMKKYNLDPTVNNVTQKQPKGFTSPMLGMGLAGAGILEAFGNARKAKKAQNQADAKLNSDSLFDANYGSRGDYVTNTQLANANFRPDQNIPMGYNASEFGKYGMQLAKVGTQVQNPYMSNPNSHPEAVLYGEPDQKISNTLKPVKREHANLEAEVGEVAVTPSGADGVPKFFKVGGKNHYDGGTPLSLPENTFIFSKTRSMIIKDPEILKELTGSTKPATPADLAKKFDFSDYVAIIQNKNSDPVERKTAEMMIESMMYKLGQIAIIQEAKKGFPSGIPLIAGPYLEKTGIDPQMLLPQTEEPEQEDPGMQQQMDPAMQEQMMQQPQQQMDPRIMQEQMAQPESMEQYPTMQSGGGYKSYEDMRMKMNAARAAMPAKPVLTLEQQRAQDRQVMGQIGEIFRSHDQGPNRINPTFPRQPSYTSSLDYAPTMRKGGPYKNTGYDDIKESRSDIERRLINEARGRITDVDGGVDGADYWQQRFKAEGINNPYRIIRDLQPKPFSQSRQANMLEQFFPPYQEKRDSRDPRYMMDYETLSNRPFNYEEYKIGGTNIMGSPVLPRYQDAGQFTSGPGRTGNFNYARQLFGPYNIDEKLIQPQEEEQPNFAQRALGPLFDYLSKEKEEENIPINTTKVYEATSPVKGFKDNDERDNFITSGKELGVDLNPVYNAYTGAILGIAELKKGLINGSIPFDIYEKEREGLVQRIDSIKTELSETNQAIDNTDSWSWNPWSTANKLQDLENILSEEKSALNVKATSLKKFREIQNDYSTLINEKKLLEEQLNDPNIDDLDLSALRRKMKDLDKALYIENIKVKDFGKRLIKNNASDVPVDEDWITNSLGEALRMDDQNTKGEQPNPYDGSWRMVGKFFTYKEYLKKHGLIGQPSVSTSTDTPTDGSTNVTPNSQMVADSIAKTTPYVEVPVETKTAPQAPKQSSNSTVSRSKNTQPRIKKVESLDGYEILN